MDLRAFIPDPSIAQALRTGSEHLFLEEPEVPFSIGSRKHIDDREAFEAIARIARGALLGLLRREQVSRYDPSLVIGLASHLEDDLAVPSHVAQRFAMLICRRVSNSAELFEELRNVATQRPIPSSRGEEAPLEDVTELTREQLAHLQPEISRTPRSVSR
jgi:hypothetical protein